MRKFFKWVFIAAGAFVGLLAVVLLAAAIIIPRKYPPEKLKEMATQKLSEILKRQVSVGEVKFNLLSGFQIADLKVGNRRGWSENAFVSAKNISISYHLFPLLWGQVSLDEVRLDSPVILIERKGLGDFNFSDMMESAPSASPEKKAGPVASQASPAGGSQPPPVSKESQAPPDPASDKTTKTLLLVTVGGIAINHGKVVYLDERYSPAQRSDLGDLNLKVRNISLLGQKIRFSLSTPLNYQKLSYRLALDGSCRYFFLGQTLKDIEVKGSVNDAGFEFSGDIKNITEDFSPDMKGSASLEMIKAAGLIPASVFSMPEGLVMSGAAGIEFRLGGALKEGMEFSGSADGKEMTLQYKDLFLKAAKTPFKVDFKSVIGTDYYNIPSLHAVFQDWEAECSLRHKNGGASSFELHTKALPLKGLSQAMPRFKNVIFEGNAAADVSAFEPRDDWKSLTVSGAVDFKGVGVFPPKEPHFLEGITGKAVFKDSSLQVPAITFKLLDGSGSAALNVNLAAKPIAYGYSLSVKKASAQEAINGSVDLFVTKDQAEYKDKLSGTIDLVYRGTGRGLGSEEMISNAAGTGSYTVTNAKIKNLSTVKAINGYFKDKNDEITFDKIEGTLAMKKKVFSYTANTVGKVGSIRAVGGIDADGNYSPDMKVLCDIKRQFLDSDAVRGPLMAKLGGKVSPQDVDKVVDYSCDDQGNFPIDFRFTGPASKKPGLDCLDLSRAAANALKRLLKEIEKAAGQAVSQGAQDLGKELKKLFQH